MQTTFKFTRSDPFYIFDAAFGQVSVIGEEKTIQNMFRRPGQEKYEHYSDVILHTFEPFITHIGLKKYMLDTSQKFRSTVDILEAIKPQSRLKSKRQPKVLKEFNKVKGQIDQVSIGIVTTYVLIAGMYYVDGGYSIVNAHKKAYKLIKEQAETLLNRAMAVYGYATYEKLNNGKTVATLQVQSTSSSGAASKPADKPADKPDTTTTTTTTGSTSSVPDTSTTTVPKPEDTTVLGPAADAGKGIESDV